MVQALAFAELLAGGLFLVSAIENIGMSELLKKGLHGAKLPSAANTADTTGAGTTSGSLADTEGPPTAGSLVPPAAGGGRTAPSPTTAGSTVGVLDTHAKALEKTLGRKLTPLEHSELEVVLKKEGKL